MEEVEPNDIKLLLTIIKDFNPDGGDSAGIVDLLNECVELSYMTEAGGVKFRKVMGNAYGYRFLVQFALTLSSLLRNQSTESAVRQDSISNEDPSQQNLSLTLSSLLDVFVKMATGCSRSRIPSIDEEHGNSKVKDLEAVQMLQDIFICINADSRELQAQVLYRMFKILSSHIENYKLCQELQLVPLLVINIDGTHPSLQEIIFAILEYAVTVVNYIPEKEVASLCCLLQKPITSKLKQSILCFFVKLLSFDQLYKKVLREDGVLNVLIDDLNHHKFLLGPDQLEKKYGSSSFKKHLNNRDSIISSMFEVEGTTALAWDCLFSLVEKSDANQQAFRLYNGVPIILPFLVSNVHRSSVLQILSCLITEDVTQAHPEELGALVEVLNGGMVTSLSGHQYKLQSEAKCDTMGVLWSILGVNNSAQRVFGESNGFSLLLIMLCSFQGYSGHIDESSSVVYIKELTYLLRLMTAGVCDNAFNRKRLHHIILSEIFYDLLSESGLLCVECEKQVIHLLLELALEIVLPPFLTPENGTPSDVIESESSCFLLTTSSGLFNPDKGRVYNAGAVRVLLRSLSLFTPKVQLKVLSLIDKLARASPFNQDNLSSVGCVELLSDAIYPFLSDSSPLLSYASKIGNRC